LPPPQAHRVRDRPRHPRPGVRQHRGLDRGPRPRRRDDDDPRQRLDQGRELRALTPPRYPAHVSLPAVTARACANIALVKYWGKRDAALNLPAAGSLSLTLAALATETTVAFDPELPADELALDGAPARPDDLARVSQFLDLVRAEAGVPVHAR